MLCTCKYNLYILSCVSKIFLEKILLNSHASALRDEEKEGIFSSPILLLSTLRNESRELLRRRMALGDSRLETQDASSINLR